MRLARLPIEVPTTLPIFASNEPARCILLLIDFRNFVPNFTDSQTEVVNPLRNSQVVESGHNLFPLRSSEVAVVVLSVRGHSLTR